MAESSKNVIKTIFNLVVLLVALGVILGGLALILFFSPWLKVVLDRLQAYDISFFVELICYLITASIVVLLSALAVYSKNIVHSALYLLGTFAGVAAIYIFLNAPFVGVAQILVYIGAVGVLILFAVMLTRKSIMEESHGEI
jgi:beta-lactamase regulating signal transducer with metallopeptidase domain